MRKHFVVIAGAVVAAVLAVGYLWPPILWSLVVVIPLIARGVADMIQTKQAVRRNFPVIGNLRYLLEMIRPEINQYPADATPAAAATRRSFHRYCW